MLMLFLLKQGPMVHITIKTIPLHDLTPVQLKYFINNSSEISATTQTEFQKNITFKILSQRSYLGKQQIRH